jgi:dimethylargininase
MQSKNNGLLFNHAIMIKPDRNMANGFTTVNYGRPNYDLALVQHRAYVSALESLGVKVYLSEPTGNPDGHFVEDMAGIFAKENGGLVGVIGNPNKEPRKKEVGYSMKIIKGVVKEIIIPDFLQASATLEFGDVIMFGKNVIIGVSTRTNIAGASLLEETLKKINPGLSILKIKVANVLHADTGMSPLNETTLLHNPAMPLPDSFPFDVIDVPKSEGYAAAVLPVNENTVMMPKGFPGTRKIVDTYFDNVLEIDTSEFMKMDGSLRCLKISWHE